MKSLSSGSESGSGKGCVTLFLLVFGGMGLLFTVLLIKGFIDTARMYAWDRVPCEVVSSEGRLDKDAPDSSPPYSFLIRYRYQYEGNGYESDRLSSSSGSFSDWSAVQGRLRKYAAGSRHTAYVNPDNARQSCLELPSLWMALFLPLPLVFVAIGFGGIYGIWFYRGKSTREAEAISAKARKKGSKWVKVIVYGVLLLIGGGVFFGAMWDSTLRIAGSAAWTAASCTVEFSRVGRHEGEDSTTYSVDALYVYRVGGVAHRSSRVGLMNVSSSGRAAKEQAVERLRPGTSVPCYYNPRNPDEAVLDRSFPMLSLLFLIPLGCFVIGLLGLVRAVPKLAAGEAEPVAVVVQDTGPKELRPAVGSLGRLLGALFFAGFWNGIVSIFAYHVAHEWRRGNAPWGLTLFLTPFLLVGLAALGAVVYYFLGLFSPKPRIVLTPGAVKLGGTATMEWRIRGATSLVKKLRITLEGREEATYAQGTTTATDKEVFRTVTVLEQVAPGVGSNGVASITVPRETMHTFEAPHNKVVWVLKVAGEIRLWPDIDEEFPVQVLPKEAQW